MARQDAAGHELADICQRLHENELTEHDRDVARLQQIGEHFARNGAAAMKLLADAAGNHSPAVHVIVNAGWQGIGGWHPLR